MAFGVKDSGFSFFLLLFYNQVLGMDAGLVSLALLIALVALSAFFAILFPVREPEQPGLVTTGLTGAASGILTGFAGMPGPPVVPYYVGRAIPRQVAKSSMILIFTFAAMIGTCVRVTEKPRQSFVHRASPCLA